MPRFTPTSEFDRLVELISQYPAGIRIDAVARVFGEEYVPTSPQGEEIKAYVRQPRALRPPVGYKLAFLEQYHPNHTAYLPQGLRDQLHSMGGSPADQTPAGTFARDILNRLLIDLSWASSQLEGNTYSRLDTARLIEFGQAAEGKDALETQMILNHKQAIEYLVFDPAHAQLIPDVIIALHAFLSDGLMADPQAVGRIRRRAVEIGGSVYLPVALPQRLETGDDTRGWGAAVFAGCTGQRHGRGGVLLGHEPQQALGGLRHLYTCGAANDSRFAAALHCDVFVENFKVGDMARYGLDYASLCKIKPSLVYCSITGFGQTGPYKDRAGYDYAVRGIGGLVSITGERDGMQGHGMQGQLSRFPKATTTAQ